MISTAAISMIPVIELRGGLPFGVYNGLPVWAAFAAGVIGNMLPIPLILLFLRHIFDWMKSFPKLGHIVEKLETKAHIKGKKVVRYRKLGLFILVAIPLPGTGAWTGALVATVLDINWKEAILPIFLGVITAGLIVMGITSGIINIL